MKYRGIFITLVVIVVFYLLSFGPILIGTYKLSNVMGNSTSMTNARRYVLNTVYYPHIYMMTVSESYFNYINWWAKLVDKPFRLYPKFRDYYSNK